MNTAQKLDKLPIKERIKLTNSQKNRITGAIVIFTIVLLILYLV